MDGWRRLFPSIGEKHQQAHPGGLALLVLAAACLFFGRLDCPLQEPQEPRYAEIARQMLAEGSWLVPTLHGQPYCDKPPLLYWLIMASYQVLGVHDWAARLIPCTAGFLTVLVTYWWGLRTVGPRTALLAGFILCLSPRFIQLGRMVLMDSPLGLCVVTAWAAAHVAWRCAGSASDWNARACWFVSALACGLGLLVKGPVALVLILGTLVCWRWLAPVAYAPGSPRWSIYLLVALLVAAPWFIALALLEPEFLSYFFWFHHVERFVTPFDHEGPFWYYVPVLLLGLLPWTLLLPGLARWLTSRSPRQAARRPAALGFFLLAFGLSLGFFSAAGCKRPAYILLTFPPLALALGTYVQALLPRRLGVPALWRVGSPLAYQLAWAALVIGLLGAVGAAAAGLIGWSAGAWLAALAGIGQVALWRIGQRRISWAATGLAGFLVMAMAVQEVLPAYSDRFAYRQLVHDQHIEPDVPVVCYPRRWDSVSFYLGRGDVQTYGDLARLVDDLQARPCTHLFLKPGKEGEALADLLRRLPPTLKFTPQGGAGQVMGGRVSRRAAEKNDP